eukprot:4450930-Pleurochrysis_carterae.AAC.1
MAVPTLAAATPCSRTQEATEHDPRDFNSPYLRALLGTNANEHHTFDLLGVLAVAITSSPLELPWVCALCLLVRAHFLAGGKLLRLPPPH